MPLGVPGQDNSTVGPLNLVSADTHAQARAARQAARSAPVLAPSLIADVTTTSIGEDLTDKPSISAHTTITDYLHRLKNYFGPARGGR
jgi:hypothetical protein